MKLRYRTGYQGHKVFKIFKDVGLKHVDMQNNKVFRMFTSMTLAESITLHRMI